MKLKRLVACAVSVCLVIVILFGTVSAVASSPIDSYDYSRPGSEYNKTLTSADILSRYLGEALSKVEADYLIKCGEVKIEYNDAITTAYVKTSAEGNTLTVRALPYSYTASSGDAITWTPASATLLGETAPLVRVGDNYEAAFTVENAATLSEVVTVSYTVSFDISSTDINSLINKAYNDAPMLRDYLQRRGEYEEYLTETLKMVKIHSNFDVLGHLTYITKAKSNPTKVNS